MNDYSLPCPLRPNLPARAAATHFLQTLQQADACQRIVAIAAVLETPSRLPGYHLACRAGIARRFSLSAGRKEVIAMKFRRLGKTQLKVSVIGIGTWQFGGEWGKEFSQDEVDAMFDRCRDLGINLIDTAECYGDHTSEAPDRAGDWARSRKMDRRHKIRPHFHGFMDRPIHVRA